MARSIDSCRSLYLLPWWRAMWSYGRVALLCGMLALTVAVGGCQRGPTWDLAPVEGTVTKDGHPLRGIEVTFLADLDTGAQGPLAKAITDEAGHYRLRTHNGDDGTVVGKHRVVFLDLEAAEKKMLRRFRGPLRKGTARLSPEIAKRLEERMKTAAEPSRIPSSYGSFNDTPLRIEVRPGPQVIDLEVK
jgi:hypothetical protein